MAHLIAIAASQAGPAHSFMTGEALRAAAERLGHPIALSVRSSLGAQGGWTDEELSSADAVIIAADMDVDRSGLPAERLHETTPGAVLADAAEVVRAALARSGAGGASDGAVAAHGVPAPAAAAVPAVAIADAARPLRIVAITSCPTGVAHTFMAAEALEQGAQALGHTIKVETQGSVGAQNTLTADEIARADLVVIAADTQVDRARFAGKRLYATGTKAAIHDAAAVFAQAAAQATVWGDAPAAGTAATPGRRLPALPPAARSAPAPTST